MGQGAQPVAGARGLEVGATQVEAEGLAAGLWPRAARVIPPTEEHVGTTVVLLRG